jgi:TonB-linked SusC/RagA family outer membrane protein
MSNFSDYTIRILKRLCFLSLFFSLAYVAQAQTVVTGKVTGPDGRSVSGATVAVKGTNTATITAEDGSFTITVPNTNATLVISYVGYETTEVSIASLNGGAANISLKAQDSFLNEVVVTGYTSQRRRDITGAVAVVDVSELKTQPTIDAQSQLQGRASGVTVISSGVPGSGATVRIRGLGSFNNNNPLYVVDGVQVGSITGLNPNDIESMQVLKDAASASIYGVRGSNGVIVITTKKGKRGTNVSYDMYYGTQVPGKGFDLLNSQEEGQLYFLARKNSGLATTGSVYGNGSTPVIPDYIFYTGAANNGVPIMNGNPGVDPSKYQLDYGRLGDPGYSPYIIVPANKSGTNWYNEITRSAPMQSHNLTLSGANDAARFLLSLNYFNQDAITVYNFYKRYTARLNSEFTLLKNFRVGENLQVFSSTANLPNNNREDAIIAQTYRPMAIIPVYTIKEGDFAGTAGGSGFGTWGNAKNPVAVLYRTKDNRSNSVNGFGNLYAELDLLSHLTARTSFGGALNTANNFSYPFIEYEHVENNANTTYNESFIRNYNWIWTNQLTYRNSFGDHDLTALAGTESQKGGGRQIIGAASTFYSYNYLPFINLGNGSVQNLGGSSTFTPVTTVSYFGKVDYSYKARYLLTALVRRDGSSKFLDPNKWGTFPAFSLGWRISEEDFMKSITWLNEFKLRGSWGKMGNEAALSGANAYTTFGSNRQSSWYDLTGTQSSPQEGFYLSFVGNPLGSWEKNVTTNVGFDATLFGNTTDVVFDWYQKKTEDLLYNPAAQAIAGAAAANNPAFFNVGSMKNNGIDLMVINRAKVSRAVNLTSTLTFTTYNNTVTAINGDQTFFDFNSPVNEANRMGSNATRNFVGSPFNTFYGYKVAGLWQSQAEIDAANSKAPADASGNKEFQKDAAPGRFRYVDVNGDAKIDADDRTIIGNPNPDFTYGLNLALQFKGFDLSTFFYGVQGRDAFNFTRWWTDFSGGFPGGRSKRALYESWLPDGSRPNANTPIQETGTNFSTRDVISSYYVEDASYFRMRNLQIGYTLPASLTNKINLSRARVYIQGTNLFTVTKYSGLDPEINSTDDRAAFVDAGTYPTVKQFLVGLNVNFR